MSRLVGLCLIVASLFGVTPLSAQSGDMQVFVFDLPDHLFASRRSAPFDATLPLVAALRSPECAELEDGPIEREQVLELVHELIAPESWEQDGADISLQEKGLLVINRPEVAAQIPAFLAQFESQVSHDCRVQIYRLEKPRESGRLQPEEVVAALKNGATLISALRLSAGRGLEFGAGRNIPFISKYYVEVAQKATVSDPVMAEVRVGLRGNVVARPVPGGGIFVRVGLRDATMVEMKSLKVASQGASILQSPTVDSDTFFGSAVLESGAAFVMSAQHGSRRSTFLIRATHRPATIAADASFGFLPLGAMGFRLGEHPEFQLSASDSSEKALVFVEHEGRVPFSKDSLIESVKRVVDPQWDEIEHNRFDELGSSLYVRHEGKKVSAAATIMARLHRAVIKNVDVDLCLVNLDDEKERAMRLGSAGPDAASLAAHADERFAFSLVTGDRTRSVFGREKLQIRDYDAEIAEASTNLAVKVQTQFEGYALELECAGLSQNQASISGELVVRRAASAVRSFDFEVGGNDWGKTASISATRPVKSGFVLNGAYFRGEWQLVGVQDGVALLIRIRR
ncbi:MAG: hypothetical protein V3W41_16320 [Planctomycetota bacterium]